MPGILPMKVVHVGGRCEHCASQHLDCDSGSPKCSHCIVAKIECRKTGSRIARACDRCRSKKIRCDGIRPSCTQCVSVGQECKVSDKLSRRAFPGYTEGLEERVKALESETRDLKDLLDAKDEKIDALSGIASEEHMKSARREVKERKDTSKVKLAQISELAAKNLRVYTFEVERNQIDGKEVSASKQSQKKTTVLGWMEDKVRSAKSTHASSTINLLVIETPDDPIKEESKSRGLYNEVLLLTKPALNHLGISINVLGTFGSPVFDKSAPDISHFGHSDVESARTFMYHIALGFFSLAFRYFPESKTCIGILLVQNYKDVAAELLRNLKLHRIVIGQPLLLPLLAQQAMAKLITSWLTQHKEVIIDAQAQTGYHHMISLSKSSELVDYSQLSAKISGTAVNIATNELCWQALAEHAKYMMEELRKESSRSTLTPKSESDSALSSFMEDQVSRLARHSQAMLREAESWQKKALILVQGIFNLIAQQDQNTSIGIARDSKTLAEESKRDSTSMKAIAIVTMTYLPGTFAATLFSMSMFNWDATNGTDVVSHRFWVYWAVTIPLVLVTFLVWIIWMRLKSEGKDNQRRRR